MTSLLHLPDKVLKVVNVPGVININNNPHTITQNAQIQKY